MMKQNILLITLLSLLFSACRKSDENLEVDLTKYSVDDYVPDPVIDQWLTDSLVIPYNIQTVYRFERNLTDISRDISPIALEKVLPTMQAVRNVFLKPYEKVAGSTFIKKFTPKQFVLYGSASYNSDGSITLGTADGGRRVVLYKLNNLDFVNGGGDERRTMRTIHHEFTHIVNQNIAIPPEFEQVTKSDYYIDWTNEDTNTDEIARDLGFVSRYARSSYTEDFAEMVSHLLVEGQVWFNNYLNKASAGARVKLRKKESLVKDYYKTYYNIDLVELQAEVQKVLRESYNIVDPVDETQSLSGWLLSNKISSITYDPAAAHYTTYGKSTDFTKIYDAYKAKLLADGDRRLNYIRLDFKDDSSMVFVANYTSSNGTGGTYEAWYDFRFTVVDASSGQVVFTKLFPESANDGGYGNGRLSSVLPAFDQHILPYLTNKFFVADWLPTTLPATDPKYRTFGGFYVSGSSSNYFYGPVVLK